MLRTRLWMGAVLIALAAGVLVLDGWCAPYFPFLFVVVLGLSLLGCFEVLRLLPPERRPPAWLCYAAVAALVVAHWPPPVLAGARPRPWRWGGSVFAGVVVAAFLAEMARFREPGESVTRVALTVWVAAYLGLLPGFLVQLRWLADPARGANLGALAVGLAVFVPKVCDIGAYFAGRL